MDKHLKEILIWFMCLSLLCSYGVSGDYEMELRIGNAVNQQELKNLNTGRVEEFFINRFTDNLVIFVQFRNMSQTSPNVYFTFLRRAKEPVITVAYAAVNYTVLVITCVVPKISDLRLQNAECTTYSSGLVSQLIVDPSAAESTDPQVQMAITAFLADIPTNIQEIFLTDSASLLATFIQHNICDFGYLLI